MANLLSTFKPKRRWLQISLRAVLVLVTLLCVGLSLWVGPAERQRRAVAAIDKFGGSVRYGELAAGERFPVTFLRRWLSPDYFDEVEEVDLTGTQVTDAGLAHLQGLTGLQGLWLINTQVTDAGLAHLQGLTGLQVLSLDNTQVTDAGLAKLRQALPKCAIIGP
jgi:Leucine-rich repeat (LRR) protein